MKSLINQLNNYQAYDLEEENIKARMIDFINNYNDVFSRQQEYGHFTGSAFLLNNDCSKFMLMHHKKLQKWVQPGGHCDGEEDILQVSLKEAKEESGINEIVPIKKSIFDLDIHLIPETADNKAHYHFDVRFLLKTENNDLLIKNNESLDLKWFAFHEHDYAHLSLQKSVVKMIKKYA